MEVQLANSPNLRSAPGVVQPPAGPVRKNHTHRLATLRTLIKIPSELVKARILWPIRPFLDRPHTAGSVLWQRGTLPLRPIRANPARQPVSDSVGATLDAQQAAATPASDEELVRQVLAGRRSAFDALVERYQRRATSVAYRLLGDLHDALEVCQDAFVRAYRGLETLEEAARFGPWLLRIVSNLALNYRRSRKRRRAELSLEDCIRDEDVSREERLADSPQADTRPGARVAESELSERVQAAIRELTDQQRTALVLFSMEEMPQKDVAEIMGVSVEAVKWHVFQARKKMKELLADSL